jgi:RNA polymerase sigma-70 factor (ECF subfamily)
MMNDAELERWFETHATALVLYARQWLDRSGAEDAVQEAFVRLLLQPTPPRQVKAWLYRAVRNEAITQWRSSRSRERRERQAALPETLFEYDATTGGDVEALTTAMAKLPPAQREILVLRVWGELTLAEVSELIEMPVSTVFQNYRTAIGTMRKRMEEPCQKKTH